MSVVTEITVADLRDVTSRLGLFTRPGIVRVGSRPNLRPRRDGPALKSKQVDSTDHHESNRALGKAMDVRPSSTHHHDHPRASVDHRSLPSSSRASVDRSSLPEQHHHRRRESVDKDQSGSSHVSRRDVELSPAVPEGDYHSHPVATQTSSRWRLSRCDGVGRLGGGCRLSRRSGLGRCWRASSGGWLGSWCRPGTRGGLRRCCRLGRSGGLCSWRLGRGGRTSRSRYPSRDDSS